MKDNNTCTFEGILGGRCSEKVYREGFCIFHYKGEKDVDEFTGKFLEYLKREEGILREDAGIKDLQVQCERFVFPNGFSLFRKKINTEIVFIDPEFQGNASFVQTTFKKSIKFFNPKFKGYVNFRSARFEGDIEFNGAEFYDNAFFQHATFNRKAIFIDNKFKKSAIFDNARFSGITSFEEVKFNGSTKFTDTPFSEDVEFTSARFLSTVSFKDTKFYGKVDFSYAHFEKDAKFEYTKKESNKEDQRYGIFVCKGDDEVDFRYSVFNQPEKVKFVKTDLSKVLFSHSNVENVHFIDVKWNTIGKVIKRKAIYDEIFDITLLKNINHIKNKI